jgi:hypothetical protein
MGKGRNSAAKLQSVPLMVTFHVETHNATVKLANADID